MTKNQIVIVTNINDPHADDVILLLQEMGHEPVRLNTDDIPPHTTMSLAYQHSGWQGSITIHTNGRVVDTDVIQSIWWRRPGDFTLPIDLSEQELEFAKDEMDHALRSLWASLDCYWISYPEYIRQASWKGSQLKRATELGFDVPRTLITTDPDEARSFFDACDGKLVFKVMTDPFLAASKVARRHPDQPLSDLYQTKTTLVTEAEVALFDSIRLVPCQFQEYVPKQVELRITVIGDDIFAAEIHSQAHEKTQLDWRNYDVDVPYRKANLPLEVAERCFALVKNYQLNFSAIDLILTPDGRYVFLENNPNGQFIFVEKLVPELRMTEALAACLIRGANS
jgi:glutathione synthase/RimK-type ligase-like ATP-grasp enzyme